jgi:hypothetical protein
MGNGNTTSVQVALQTALGPGANGLVESFLSRNRCLVSSLGSGISNLGIRVAGLGSSSTISGSTRSRGRITQELSAMLADEGTELVELGPLGNRDVVLVAEFLELSLTPGIDKLVGQSGISLLSAGRSAGLLLLGLEVRETRVAANRGNQLVTGSWLRGRDSMGIEPLLEVRLGPGVIKPVTRVGDRLTGLLSSGLIRGAGLLEESVTLAGLRNCDGDRSQY